MCSPATSKFSSRNEALIVKNFSIYSILTMGTARKSKDYGAQLDSVRILESDAVTFNLSFKPIYVTDRLL